MYSKEQEIALESQYTKALAGDQDAFDKFNHIRKNPVRVKSSKGKHHSNLTPPKKRRK